MMFDDTHVQAPLFAAEDLSPLPVGYSGYVCVLQNKSGELDALGHASASAWERMTPLLELVGPRNPRDPMNASLIAGWVKRASAVVGTRPLYLDILRLEPTASVRTTGGLRPALGEIYAAARKRDMRFIPVVSVGETTDAHMDLVRAALIGDARGVGLRYRILKVVPPTGLSRRAVLETELERLSVKPEDCDLLIDLEYMDEDKEIDPADVAAQLDEMDAAGRWRSLVVIGTSMPKMMGAIKEGTVGALPRREWDLWTEILAQQPSRVPAFGDYAVQNPAPPTDGGSNKGRSNIRYTAERETLVARGFGPAIQQGPEQYRTLCQQLVARPEFAGRTYSWGDETIADCADEVIEPGSRNAWRGAGTSHHFQLVTDELRRLSAPGESDA
jgi:hypothetical protein